MVGFAGYFHQTKQARGKNVPQKPIANEYAITNVFLCVCVCVRSFVVANLYAVVEISISQHVGVWSFFIITLFIYLFTYTISQQFNHDASHFPFNIYFISFYLFTFCFFCVLILTIKETLFHWWFNLAFILLPNGNGRECEQNNENIVSFGVMFFLYANDNPIKWNRTTNDEYILNSFIHSPGIIPIHSVWNESIIMYFVRMFQTVLCSFAHVLLIFSFSLSLSLQAYQQRQYVTSACRSIHRQCVAVNMQRSYAHTI